MNRKIMAAIICLAVVGIMGNALAQQQAPVAGTSIEVIGITVDELVTVTNGWSAKKQIMGKDVYNDKSEKLGVVYDLIITPGKAVTYAIVGTGFLGLDKHDVANHDVAIPFNQFKMKEGKITLPGATKDTVKAMPAFQYHK
jgi:sporulation protein YlmC with PRC-barrel domain